MEVVSHEIGWISESWDAIEQENYSLAIKIYEKEVESNPGEILKLFYLGIAYLLNGEENLAQMTWFSAITESEDTEFYSLQSLSNTLDREARRQVEKEKIEIS
jgi:hypothetical protein